MRTLFVSVVVLLLFAFWQPAQAEFVLVFDDPATAEIDIRVVDNGLGDLEDDLGIIEFSHTGGGLDTYVIANSKGNIGGAGSPQMRLGIEYISVRSDIVIKVTDTDFTAGLARAVANTEGAIANGTVSFDYFGDSGNQEFGNSDVLYSSPTFEAPGEILNQGDDERAVTLDPGSLTLSVTLTADDVKGAGIFYLNLFMEPSDTDVPVPDVTGLEQSEAEANIEARGLKVGSISTELSDTVPVGLVIRSNPGAGEFVAPGSSVNLVVSLGNDFEEVANPAGLAGLWYDPAFDGEGLNIIVAADGSWFLYHYGWRVNGNRLWLLSDTSFEPVLYGNSVTLDMFIANSGIWADPDPELSTWGQITIFFDTCTTGRAYLQGEDGTKTLVLVKLLGIGSLDCDSG